MTREVPTSSTPVAVGRTSRFGWVVWFVDPVRQWIQDHCLMFSASISFFAAFSLAPTLVIVIAVASVFFGADAVQGRLFDEISGVVGPDAAHALEAIVANAWHADIARSTALLSAGGVLIGASATFSSLHSALNVIWPTPIVSAKESIVSLLRVRLMSFGLVVGSGLLVVALLVLDALVEVLGHWAFGDGNPFIILSSVTQRAISLGMLTLAFTLLLKFLPTTRMMWRDAALGATAAAMLFEAGKRLFAFYLAHAGTANMFGAAGSLAIILMWLYYSAAVFLLGAELAATAARRRTHREAGWR
ncbi:YihY/virulence factor BrkB family protein [Caballeronia sp. GAFFF2]|uniref:YihY/virulence factor BrkB family protein n=1 Tax=Caballeronia sp. GAFFF2 TaxID=2921741 RepID=UPI002027E3A3|nr:YihY/virulence factor BrkB family protein [Caballeronia sp. GAFFF2]